MWYVVDQNKRPVSKGFNLMTSAECLRLELLESYPDGSDNEFDVAFLPEPVENNSPDMDDNFECKVIFTSKFIVLICGGWARKYDDPVEAANQYWEYLDASQWDDNGDPNVDYDVARYWDDFIVASGSRIIDFMSKHSESRTMSVSIGTLAIQENPYADIVVFTEDDDIANMDPSVYDNDLIVSFIVKTKLNDENDRNYVCPGGYNVESKKNRLLRRWYDNEDDANNDAAVVDGNRVVVECPICTERTVK